MKKLFWILLTGFLGISVPSLAQVTSVSILGVGSGGPGQSVPVTFVITNTNLFYDVNYDILFSSSSSVTNTAYSSYLKGPMICSGEDAGYNYSSGTLATTIIQNATVPGYQYSGYVIVIANENQPYLTCASTSANTAFTMVPTPTVTTTNTPTLTLTMTATNTATQTATMTPTMTATNTITQTPTMTPTQTKTGTPTMTTTNTATKTATMTATNTATKTASSTPTSFFTYTVTQTPTVTGTIFYPQVNANVFVQVTATGTPQGQNIWIPEPPGWGGAGGITVSGSVSVTGGQFVALQPTSTVTGTPTPTGSPTGTPTNTPTPIYAQDECVTVISNLAQIDGAANSAGSGTFSFNHTRKGGSIELHCPLYPYLPTATPIYNLYTVSNATNTTGGPYAQIPWMSGLKDTIAPCFINLTGSSNLTYGKTYYVAISNGPYLATITPTAVPVTIISCTAP